VASIVLFVLLLLALLLGSVLVFPSLLVKSDLGRGSRLSDAELVKAKNDVRTTLLQGIGGLLLVVGAVATWRQLVLGREQLLSNEELTRQQLRMSEAGQIADRFTRAIDQLGTETVHLQLGGIYSLDAIASSSPPDAPAIFEILATYVRRRSPWPPPSLVEQETGAAPEDVQALRDRAPDVQAAMTVIGKRPRVPDPFADDSSAEVTALAKHVLLLEETDLRRALLIDANLQRVHLRAACLQGAELTGADLRLTVLVEADLRGAQLQGADLRGAILDGAVLSEAVYDRGTKWPAGFNASKAGLRLQES
jgi:hypothetical protein